MEYEIKGWEVMFSIGNDIYNFPVKTNKGEIVLVRGNTYPFNRIILGDQRIQLIHNEETGVVDVSHEFNSGLVTIVKES